METKIKKDLKPKRNFLLNLDWFDENFICNFLYEKPEIKNILNHKRYRLSEENISSRVITHWQKIELITDDRPDEKGWRIFSMTEIIWIHIIIKLRGFGLDLHKIKRVKNYLDTYYTEDNLSKFPLLDFYIMYGLSTKEPVKLIVFGTGESFLARQSDIDIAKQFGTIMDDYISIDLNQLVLKGLKKKDIKTDYLNYSLSPIEKEIKTAIIFEEVNSLTIKVNNNKEFIVSKEFIKSSRNEVNTLLSKLKYGESITSKNGNKTIHKIIEKKKIKKN